MKKIVEDLGKRGIEKYTIYKLDNPFPFYLLDLNKYNISRLYYNRILGPWLQCGFL